MTHPEMTHHFPKKCQLSDTSLCTFIFLLSKQPFDINTQVHFHCLWTARLIWQGQSEFTSIHQKVIMKCCFHAPFQRHLQVNHVVNRSCRRSPERPDPWVTICSGHMEHIRMEKGLQSCQLTFASFQEKPHIDPVQSSSLLPLLEPSLLTAVLCKSSTPSLTTLIVGCSVWPLGVIICFLHKLFRSHRDDGMSLFHQLKLLKRNI